VHAACAEALGSTPDAKFEACIAPLAEVAHAGKATSELDPQRLPRPHEVFGVVGKPVLIGADEGPPGLIEQILTETAQAFGAEYEGQLAEMSSISSSSRSTACPARGDGPPADRTATPVSSLRGTQRTLTARPTSATSACSR